MIIAASFNYATSDVSFATVEDNSIEVCIRMGFASNGSTVEFDGLSFGWSLESDGKFWSGSYPSEGSVYLRTDQPFLSEDAVVTRPNTPATLEVWSINSGVRIVNTLDFVTPFDEPFFPSWTWGDGEWTAPVPYPDEDVFYQWNEEQQAWVEASE